MDFLYWALSHKLWVSIIGMLTQNPEQTAKKRDKVVHQPGTHPTDGILTEFEMRSKFWVFLFKIC